MLVGLNVIDDEKYQEYRKAMRPILSEFEGDFGYDFKIAEVLMSESEDTINRVFTINFPDKETVDAFFSNAEYLKVKEQYFEKSVESTTLISGYERDA